MRNLILTTLITVATVSCFGQSKPHFKSELDSLRIAVKTHETAERIMGEMMYKMAVKNDSLITAYNNLLTEYKQFAIKVKTIYLKSK